MPRSKSRRAFLSDGSRCIRQTSTAKRRESDADVRHGEPAQVPRASTRDLPGFSSPQPGELPLEPQARELFDDALTYSVGYLVAAQPEDVDPGARGQEVGLGSVFEAHAGTVVHGDRVGDELAVVGGHAVAVGEVACPFRAANGEVDVGHGAW